MFFDYPCSEDVYENLKQKVCASLFHYMNYQSYRIDTNAVMKTCAGMIRYCCKNQNGEFVLNRASAALGVTDEISELLLEIYSDAGMIKILERGENSYVIKMCDNVDYSKLTGTMKYEEFNELMNTINEYKNSFMKIEL